MRIAQVVGGYSLGGADVLRRAMGKKKPEEMAKQRSIFVDGAKAKGIAEDTATQLFDLMEKFAGYGFNKSHSAAYALLAYQTAYFKAHYPAAFMAANLTAVMDDTDKVRELVEDSQASGLTILGPDINRGGYRFEPVDARTIRYGLGAVKGTGRSAIEHMVAVRAGGGPFTGLFDFCARMDKQFVNRRVAEALVRAGAFDAVEADRARLAASVGRALESAEHAAAHVGQASLFGGADAAAPADEHAPCKPWSERERLANEKLALGFYFSGHLFDQYEVEARRLAPTRLADLRGGPGTRSEAVRVAGIIVSARTQNSRRGRMCVVVLDDHTAQLELTIYAELYDRKRAAAARGHAGVRAGQGALRRVPRAPDGQRRRRDGPCRGARPRRRAAAHRDRRRAGPGALARHAGAVPGEQRQSRRRLPCGGRLPQRRRPPTSCCRRTGACGRTRRWSRTAPAGEGLRGRLQLRLIGRTASGGLRQPADGLRPPSLIRCCSNFQFSPSRVRSCSRCHRCSTPVAKAPYLRRTPRLSRRTARSESRSPSPRRTRRSR